MGFLDLLLTVFMHKLNSVIPTVTNTFLNNYLSGPLGNLSSGKSGCHPGTGVSLGSKENICEECTQNPLDLIDASIQVDLSDPEDESTQEDSMGKKRLGLGDLGKNKKGIPLYSREDIREQYCINEKELQVLDKNQRRSLLGCFTNHNQSGISPCSSGRNRKSLLGSCIARTSSEEDLHKKYDENLLPPLSPGARSNNTWNARARMYHYGGGYHGVDEEDGFDEHYFRRRPKSFCMTVGPPHPQMAHRYPVDPGLRLSMGSLVEGGEFHHPLQHSGAATLRHSSTSQYPSSCHLGHPQMTSYYGVHPPTTGNYAIPHGYHPIYSSKEFEINSECRTQTNTPDLLIHRRQTTSSVEEGPLHQRALEGSSKSSERLIDYGHSGGECLYGDTVITPEMARQVMIDRMKRNSMRTQATQTDVNRGLRADIYGGDKIQFTPANPRTVQMISEGVQTNGILKSPPPYQPPPPPIRSKQLPPHIASQLPGYKLQVYQIDSSKTSPPVTKSPPKEDIRRALPKRNTFQKSRSEGEILEDEGELSPPLEKSKSQSQLLLAIDNEEEPVSDRELPELAPIPNLPSPKESEDNSLNSRTEETVDIKDNIVEEKSSADIIVQESTVKRKQDLTLDFEGTSADRNENESDKISENTLIWQRGISNGEVRKKKQIIEQQIQISSKPVLKQQFSIDSPSLARSPAMHDGFRVEDYVVERTPVNTPDGLPFEDEEAPTFKEPKEQESEEKTQKKVNASEEGASAVVEPPTDFADSPIKILEKSKNKEFENGDLTKPYTESKIEPVVKSSKSSNSSVGRSRSRSRSRSKERLLAKMADAAEAPILSFNEEDDISGLYLGNYKRTAWAYIGYMKTSYTEEPSHRLGRSESVDSTRSEREFKKKHQAITHRMVHRKSSALMYSRILERSFECNTTLRVQRIQGEFGFRIHGSRPVVISAIEPETPAQKSGLEVGDIILSINGVNVLDLPHTEVVRTAQTGSDEIELGIARVSEELETPEAKFDESLRVLASGYLWKLSRCDSKRWIRRWFILRADSCFYFFKTERDLHPLGVFLIGGATILRDDNEKSESSSDFSFKVRWNSAGVENVLELAAENSEDLNKWILRLSEISKKTATEDLWADIINQRLAVSARDFPCSTDCQGYLLKLDTHSKAWKKRYCLLCDSCLYLYSDVESPSAIATLCLQGYKVQSTASLGGNKRHAFELIPPLKNMKYFYFVAETETEKKRWLASLEYSMDSWVKVSLMG